MIVDDFRRQVPAAGRGPIDALLGRAAFVRIQNVADFFWLHEQDEWDLREDFPCLAAPWPVFWMEWRSPRVARFGSEVHAAPLVTAMAVLGRMVEMYQPGKRPPSAPARWWLDLIYCSPHVGVVGEAHYPVGDDGRFVPIRHTTPDGESGLIMPSVFTGPAPATKAEQELLRNSLQTCFAYPAMLALSFCHAKNIALQTESVPRKLQAARARRGHVPVERFHTLDIGPIRQIIEQAMRTGNVASLRQALHFVRGHFKTYDATHKLFGKYEGTYWWDQHARGDVRAGQIRKDYAVHPEKPR